MTAKCYIDFNADFWWYDDESDYIPVISGGLVATTKEWWQLSGGFDDEMRGWGGENTDQSLRAWLCDGDILRAKSSIIAHMWRTNTDSRTTAKYRLHFPGSDNNARVAKAWFDEFVGKYHDGAARDAHINVSSMVRLRERLQCKPFAYFLHRFRRIFIDAHVLPPEIFKIRRRGTSSCLMRTGSNYEVHECSQATWFHLGNHALKGFPMPEDVFDDAEPPPGGDQAGDVTCGAHHATSCAGCSQGHGSDWCHGDCAWVFGACVNRELHDGALDRAPRRKCCSGIRQWNTMECFDRLDAESGPLAYFCDVMGGNGNQQYLFGNDGKIRHQTGQCVDVQTDGRRLKVGSCKTTALWEQIEAREPEETALYRAAITKHGLTSDIPDH